MSSNEMSNRIVFKFEGKREMMTFHPEANLDTVLTKAAEMICFSDCSDCDFIEAVVEGRHYEYAGWQPDMLIEFIDSETNETVWGNNFYSWEH